MAVCTDAAVGKIDPHGRTDSNAGALTLAARRGLPADEALCLTLRGALTADDALSFALQGGLKAEEAFSLALRSGLTAEEVLLEQLMASFDRRGDFELMEWSTAKDPRCSFFLFKMKASAKAAQVSWWKKKYSRFPPERSGYTYALRVARLVAGEDGFRLEQAGEDGQPGAISYGLDMSYRRRPHPKAGIFKEGSSVPLWEVAIVKRLPAGDGISITSYVDGLGVKFGDILFLMPCRSSKVALSFTERSFYVSSKFTEEPLYARDGLNFIDITGSIETLIKKLYQMYEQEERDKIMHERENQDNQEREELVRHREEQEKEILEALEMKKLEELKNRRAESRKYRNMRKEMKEMVRQMKMQGGIPEKERRHEECAEAFFYTSASGGIQLGKDMDELCQREDSCKEMHEKATMPTIQTYECCSYS